MKTIIFRDELEAESVQKLIDAIEQPHVEEKEHEIRILFSCPGGFSDMALAVIDCINGLPEKFKVELVVTYQANSAAFDIFVKTKCKKRLYTDANSIVHLYSRLAETRDIIHDKDSYDKFLLDRVNDLNEEYLGWLEGLEIFTQKELKRISKGKDVYVERERLQKIIDNQNRK